MSNIVYMKQIQMWHDFDQPVEHMTGECKCYKSWLWKTKSTNSRN